MKNDIFLQDRLSAANISVLNDICSSQSENFNELTVLAGLDPTNDFRFSDLRGIDFSNSNLCGYDFTGSDLRGCFGSNIIWDNSTSLTDARISSSVFFYKSSESEYFRRHPDAMRTVDILNKDHWTNTSSWIFKNTKQSKDLSMLMYICGKLAHESKDRSVKTDALLAMARLFKNREHHKWFLLSFLAQPNIGRNETLAALANLEICYFDDLLVHNTLFNFLQVEDFQICKTALSGILRTRFFVNNIGRIVSAISGPGKEYFRSELLARVVELRAPDWAEILNLRGRYIDYEKLMSREQIKDIASGAVMRRQFQPMDYENIGGVGFFVQITDRELRRRVEEKASELSDVLKKLKADGIPFSFET